MARYRQTAKAFDDELASPEEYYGRLERRLREGTAIGRKMLHITNVARLAADEHMRRLDFAVRRRRRAVELNDHIAREYERQVILALLYETFDTSYIVMNLLDFDQLDLSSSAYGEGLTGESAADVVRTLEVLNSQAGEVLEYERRLGVVLDFSEAVDEKEGVTYLRNRHWQDFIPGDVQASFSSYFRRAQQVIHKRLNQVPHFWQQQTVRQYLHNHQYESLLEVLQRLEQAALQ